MGAQIICYASDDDTKHICIGGIKLNMHGNQIVGCQEIQVIEQYDRQIGQYYVLSIPVNARIVHMEKTFGSKAGHEFGSIMRDFEPDDERLGDDFQEILQKLVDQHVPFGTSVHQAEPALV